MTRVAFDEQVAIVTGGGRNLGRAYCLDLASRGAAVVVNDVRAPDQDGQQAADEVVAEIVDAGGRAVACFESVATEKGAEAVVGAALEHFGRVDAIINNAGIMRNGFFEEITPQKLDEVIAVNLRGSFLVTQAAWPAMRDAGYGRIVMVSSAGGMFSSSGLSNYAAAKAGVYGLCRALAYEGEEHGIRVNTVLPLGGSMFSKDMPPPGRAAIDVREALAPRRLNEAVAPLVTLLASSECPVTGEAFSAGYGRYARVFVGLTPGWAAADATGVAAEEVLEQFDHVRDLEGFIVPRNQHEEVAAIAETVGAVQA